MAKRKETYTLTDAGRQPFPYSKGIPSAYYDMSLKAIRDHIHDIAQRACGTTCPACGGRTQFYRRAFLISQGLALRTLCDLYAAEPNKWWSYKELGYRSREYTYLNGFGLLRSKPTANALGVVSKKGGSGKYQPTEDGIAFNAGETTLPKSLIEYKGTIVALNEVTITIDDVLTSRIKPTDGLMQPVDLQAAK